MLIFLVKSKEVLICENIKLNKIRFLEKPLEIYSHLLRKIFCFKKNIFSSESAEKIILDMRNRDDNMNLKKINKISNSDINKTKYIYFEAFGKSLTKFYLPIGEFDKKKYIVEKNVF